MIDNLTTVMGTLAARDQQLSDLVVSLQQFVTGLAGDREAIFDSLQTIDELAVSTSGFLEDARAPLAADIEALGDLSGNLADSGDLVERLPADRPGEARPDRPGPRSTAAGSTSSCAAASGTVTLPARPAVVPGDAARRARPSRRRSIESGAEGCS